MNYEFCQGGTALCCAYPHMLYGWESRITAMVHWLYMIVHVANVSPQSCSEVWREWCCDNDNDDDDCITHPLYMYAQPDVYWNIYSTAIGYSLQHCKYISVYNFIDWYWRKGTLVALMSDVVHVVRPLLSLLPPPPPQVARPSLTWMQSTPVSLAHTCRPWQACCTVVGIRPALPAHIVVYPACWSANWYMRYIPRTGSAIVTACRLLYTQQLRVCVCAATSVHQYLPVVGC